MKSNNNNDYQTYLIQLFNNIIQNKNLTFLEQMNENQYLKDSV